MADKFLIAVIAWDQKEGGILEAVQPKLRLTSKTTMNIYNMHRIRRTGPSYGAIRLKLNNGERYNVLTFFTGYGGSTSPDGFTGNYGCEFGVAERVLAMFLPMDVKSSEYEEVIARLGSRIFLEEEGIEDRVKICGDLVKNSGSIKKADGIFKILESHLDRKLGLSTEDKCLAFEYESKALRYLVEEKLDTIQDLRINPAQSAASFDQKKIADAEEKEKEI